MPHETADETTDETANKATNETSYDYLLVAHAFHS
jgi:hypothetical protein